jgi:hypothetical protein
MGSMFDRAFRKFTASFEERPTRFTGSVAPPG